MNFWPFFETRAGESGPVARGDGARELFCGFTSNQLFMQKNRRVNEGSEVRNSHHTLLGECRPRHDQPGTGVLQKSPPTVRCRT